MISASIGRRIMRLLQHSPAPLTAEIAYAGLWCMLWR